MKTKKKVNINYENMSREGVETVRAATIIKKSEQDIINNILVNSIIPPEDNVLRKVIKNFNDETDIPLEIPIFYTIAFIAGFLLNKKVRLVKNGQFVYPDLWLIILAPSGASKTFSANIIEAASGIKPNFSSGFASAKSYIVELKKNNFGFLFRDEIGQMLKAIDQQTYMSELKDYILKTKDGKEIIRETAEYRVNIQNPHLVFLGSTVSDTFDKVTNIDSIFDGSYQRFMFVFAKKDKAKKLIDFIDYNYNNIIDGLKEYFDKIKALLPDKPDKTELQGQKEITINDITAAIEKAEADEAEDEDEAAKFIDYTLCDNAVDVIKDEMKLYFSKRYEYIPDSFRRRIYFEIYKIALIYHFILLKDSKVIDEIDLRYASKTAILHMKYLVNVLDLLDFNSVITHINNVDNAVDKLIMHRQPVNINAVTRHLLRNHKTTYADINETKKIVTALIDTTNYDKPKKTENPQLNVISNVAGGN